MDPIVKYVRENKDRFIKEMEEVLRIPSVSTLPEHIQDMHSCAELLKKKLLDAGMSKAEIFQTEGHPVVYAEWMGAPGKPTVLVYGHYDVQPVDSDSGEWFTPPFEPVIKDGKIFARGATDDKGQLYTHVKGIETLFKTTGSLPLNVKVIFEGEEEIGSPNLVPFLNRYKKMLACDAVVISDTSLFAPMLPTITYGLRGLAYMEVEVLGPSKDLHSGSFGGSVVNPVNALAKMIASLHDKKGKVTIPGFYDDVVPLSAMERKVYKTLPYSEKGFAKEAGVQVLDGEAGYSTLERIWARPTLDCNGIVGGFTGAGAKTIIPAKASAKISMRLVANQDPKKIAALFTKHIKAIAPQGVKVNVKSLHGGSPALTPLDAKATKAAAIAMEKAFGKKTVFVREGGSIPIVVSFGKILKAPAVLMGFGLNSENLHSPNEHFSLKHFELGVISSAYFMKEFAH